MQQPQLCQQALRSVYVSFSDFCCFIYSVDNAFCYDKLVKLFSMMDSSSDRQHASSSMSSNSSSVSLREEFNRYTAQVNYALTFIQAFLTFFGVLGNLLALIVINRKSLRHTSSAVFITYLAIFDSAVLLLHTAHLVRPRRNLLIHCSLTYLTDLATLTANWILVIITLGKNMTL